MLQQLTTPQLSDNDLKLFDALDKVGRHGLGAIVLETEVKVVKKSRLTGEATPSKYCDLRKITFMTVSVHHDYEKGVQNRQDKVGSDEPAFSAQAPSGMHHYSSNGVILQANRDDNQMYARFYCGFNNNTNTRTVYVDQNDVPVEISKGEMGEYFTGYSVEGTKPESTKQAKAGIKKKDQIVVRSAKFQSVKYFAKGDNCFNRLSETLMDILNLV